MKKLSFLLLTVVAFSVVLASCAPKSAVSNKPVYLRLTPEEGATYSIQTKMSQDITTHIAGRSINSHVNMNETVNLTVVKRHDKDSLLLHLNIKHIAVNTSAMGRKMSFDSDSSQSANNSKFSDFFNKLANSSVILKITPLGKVLDVSGLKQLKDAVKNSSSITNPAVKGMLKKMFTKKKLKKGFFSIGMYPKDPITEGTQWDNKKTITSKKMPMSLHTTYTVKKIKADSVWLSVKGKLSTTKDSITVRGMTIPVQASGTQTGTYKIARSTGMISSGFITQDINMTMSVMGRSLNMDMKGTTTITAERVE